MQLFTVIQGATPELTEGRFLLTAPMSTVLKLFAREPYAMRVRIEHEIAADGYCTIHSNGRRWPVGDGAVTVLPAGDWR